MKKTLVVMGLVVAVMAMMVAPAFAQGEAMVRVTHASPDAGAVDVCVNGSAAFKDLAFGRTTDYANLPAGSYDVQVYAAGSNSRAPRPRPRAGWMPTYTVWPLAGRRD
jgi:hypothetical protein